jgi:hypothetical protein
MQAATSAKSRENQSRAIIRPADGTDEVYLRTTETEVRATLGKPDHIIRKFQDSYFYIYVDKGMDLDFGKKGGRLKIIFFYRQGCEGHKGALVVTDRGVRPGDTRSKVLKIYGPPDDQHDSTSFNDGFYLREWAYYANGIQFQFGRDHRVDIISVSKKKKRS